MGPVGMVGQKWRAILYTTILWAYIREIYAAIDRPLFDA
jgi:hypothetical protein